MPNDPFTGMKLTEQGAAEAPTGLDQRLFSTPPPKPPPAEPDEQAAPAPPQAKPKARPKAKKQSKAPTPAPAPDGAFDINAVPAVQEPTRLTVAEQRALEDVKYELRRLLDRPVSKTDIVRCGLHHVLADFNERKGASYLAEQLRRKGR